MWRLTLQHSPVGDDAGRPGGRPVRRQRLLLRHDRLRRRQLRKMRVQDITHPDDLAIGVDLMAVDRGGRSDVLSGAQALCLRGRRGSGETCRSRCCGMIPGNRSHFISQILDVTAQHDFERRIAAASATIELQSRMVQAVYDSVDVGLLLIDRSGHYDRMNRRHEEFLDLAYPDGHHGQAGQLGLRLRRRRDHAAHARRDAFLPRPPGRGVRRPAPLGRQGAGRAACLVGVGTRR